MQNLDTQTIIKAQVRHNMSAHEYAMFKLDLHKAPADTDAYTYAINKLYDRRDVMITNYLNSRVKTFGI